MHLSRRSFIKKIGSVTLKVRPEARRYLHMKNYITEGLLKDPEATKKDLSKHVERRAPRFSVEEGFWSKRLGNKDGQDSPITTEENSHFPPPAA